MTNTPDDMAEMDDFRAKWAADEPRRAAEAQVHMAEIRAKRAAEAAVVAARALMDSTSAAWEAAPRGNRRELARAAAAACDAWGAACRRNDDCSC